MTIANNIGGGGGELATMLGEKLKWPVFDRDILKEMAGNDEVRTRLYATMDERDVGWFEQAFRSFMHGDLKKDDYFHRLTETILVLAHKHPSIFVGRAADLILPRSTGLRVKVIASLDSRITNFAGCNNIGLKEAVKQMDQIERSRVQFIRDHFGIDMNEPTRFDLLINIEKISNAEAIEMIILLLKGRKMI